VADSLRKLVQLAVLARIRDAAIPGVRTVQRMAYARLPEGGLPAVILVPGAETAPLPGEHESVNQVNVTMRMGVVIIARDEDDEDLSDTLEDLHAAVRDAVAGVGLDPTLGGLVDWLVYAGCEPDAPVSASEAATATASRLVHFAALRPEADSVTQAYA
jgi:hypothetical protein